MKKSFAFLFFLLLSTFVSAQERVKQKEVGITVGGLSNFGFTYRTGTNKSLWRFTSLFISGRNNVTKSSNREINDSNIGFAVQVGREYRKIMVNKLELRYGADLSLGFDKTKYSRTGTSSSSYSDVSTVFSPTIYFIVGVNYVIKEKIVLGAEFAPYFGYQIGKTTETELFTSAETKGDVSGFKYGISSSSLSLSIVYRL